MIIGDIFMAEKKIYELTQKDLEEYPIWFFPMDDNADDELTIRSYDSSCDENDYQMIIRTFFKGKSGEDYLGYIYWSAPPEIEDLKPVVFVSNEKCVTFWNGIVEASWDEYDAEQKKIRDQLPLNFLSEELKGLKSVSGVIDGLYFIDNQGIVAIN